jgi:hypothetical protein
MMGFPVVFFHLGGDLGNKMSRIINSDNPVPPMKYCSHLAQIRVGWSKEKLQDMIKYTPIDTGQ